MPDNPGQVKTTRRARIRVSIDPGILTPLWATVLAPEPDVPAPRSGPTGVATGALRSRQAAAAAPPSRGAGRVRNRDPQSPRAPSDVGPRRPRTHHDAVAGKIRTDARV